MKRLEYIDIMRGIAILLVVMGHICYYGYEHSFVRSAIYSVHMPIFFFISGFCAQYAYKIPQSAKQVGDYILKKIRAILLPYWVWCLIICPFILSNPITSIDRIMELGLFGLCKSEYWFLPCLFVLTMCHLLYSLILNTIHCEAWWWNMIVIGGICGLMVGLYIQAPLHLFKQVLCYCLPYFVGVLCAKFPQIRVYVTQTNWMFVCAVVALCVFIRMYHIAADASLLAQCSKLICGFSAIVVMMHLLANDYIGEGGGCVFARQLAVVGRNTLGIYLMHFAFLDGIRLIGGCNSLELFLQLLILAIFVSYICLGCIYIINKSRILRGFILGKSFRTKA